MTPDHLLMLQGAAAALLLFLPSLFAALFPHPTDLQAGAARVLLQVLGRLSVLPHGVGLRLPLVAQVPKAPASAAPPFCVRCGGAPLREGRPIFHNVGCTEIPDRKASPSADTIPDLPSMVTAPRVSAPLAMLLGLSLVLSSACLSATDHARAQLTQALKLATSVQQKFKAQDAGFQIKIVETATSAPEGAKALLSWRERRKAFTGAAQRCDSVIEDAADQLLLSDRAAGVNAARQAQLCAEGLRESLLKIFDGGL